MIDAASRTSVIVEGKKGTRGETSRGKSQGRKSNRATHNGIVSEIDCTATCRIAGRDEILCDTGIIYYARPVYGKVFAANCKRARAGVKNNAANSGSWNRNIRDIGNI